MNEKGIKVSTRPILVLNCLVSSNCEQHKWWSYVKTFWVRLCLKMSNFPTEMSDCTLQHQTYARPETYIAAYKNKSAWNWFKSSKISVNDIWFFKSYRKVFQKTLIKCRKMHEIFIWISRWSNVSKQLRVSHQYFYALQTYWQNLYTLYEEGIKILFHFAF